MGPQGGGEGEGGVTTLGGEGEGGLPLHLPAAEEVSHRALHQVAGDGHHASLDILAWYFCLTQALVFSICRRVEVVAKRDTVGTPKLVIGNFATLYKYVWSGYS